MTLADLRKLSIRKRFQIRFHLRNGMECVVSDRGVAHVPVLKSTPDFNLEEELSFVKEFRIDAPADPLAKKTVKAPVKPRSVGREELTAMYASVEAPAAAPTHEDD